MQAGRFLELKQFTFVKEMTKYQLGYFKSCSVIRKEPLGLTGLRSTPLSSVDSFPSGIHTRLPCAGLTECHGFQWICLGNPAPPIHVWHHTSLCLLIFCISPPKQGIHPSLTFHTRSLRTCMTGQDPTGMRGALPSPGLVSSHTSQMCPNLATTQMSSALQMVPELTNGRKPSSLTSVNTGYPSLDLYPRVPSPSTFTHQRCRSTDRILALGTKQNWISHNSQVILVWWALKRNLCSKNTA